MSTGDDPPKKPPRASWEQPDPDEAAPKTPASTEGSKSKPTKPWVPPPVEDPWAKKKPRPDTKPPRASWEPPEPDEAAPAGSVSGSWETPSVIVEPVPAERASGADETFALTDSDAYAQPQTSAYAEPEGQRSGAHAQPEGRRTGEYAQSASGAHGQPEGRSGEYAPSTSAESTSGEYAPSTSAESTSGEYAQSASGAYAESSASGEYVASGEYAQPASGAYARPTERDTLPSGEYASGTYVQPSGTYSSGAYATQAAQPTASGSATSGAVVAPMSTASSSAVPKAAASRDSDDPMAPLSALSEDNALRAAVGAKLAKEPKKKPPPPDDFDDGDGDDFGDTPKRKGSMWWVIALILVGVLGLGIGALVIFGNMNKQRYLIACEPQEVHAKQGRGFPPWGERSIDDEGMWKPIKIPPEAECRERDTEDEQELSRWYLEILTERASSLLTAREVTKIDEAAGLLEQALLHARSPDRRDQRRDIERLLGDVGYWRASAKLKDAAAALADAAKQFDAAAAQRPRHVSDASAWATYVRKLVDELRAGPNGALTAFPPTPPAPGREPAPPGVALPVEPPAAGSGSAEPPPTPPDAGLPTGGVLL